MNGAGCARAASDLTRLLGRLQQTGRTLEHRSRLPEDDFGGLSGDAFRRHAARSASEAARAATDVALLAGALAALGRGLDSATEVRERAEASPSRAAELHRAADAQEHLAQQQWRAAVATYAGRPAPPVVVPGTVVHQSPPRATADATSTARGGPVPGTPTSGSPAPVAAAPAAFPASPVAAHPLEAELVTPPPLDAEVVTPPPPRCGTPEVVLDDHA